MNKNKNRKKLGIIILCMVCIVVLWIYFKPAPDYTRIPVRENEEDYTRIAEIYYQDYLSNHERLNSDIMAYSIADHSNILSVTDYFSPESGYKDRYIELDEEETISANVIIDTYRMLDYKGWDRVYVYDTFVSFCTVNGVESLVYSANGKRPSYISTPNDDFKYVTVYRITNHWYHCREFMY